MMVRTYLYVILLLLLAIPLAACRTAPEPTPTPTPELMVAQSAARLAELSGFHFVLETSGPPTYLDPGQTLALRRLEGDFVAPDRVRAVVRVAVPGLVTEVSVIGIGERQWQTNVLTGAWEELPPTWDFNPAVLFDEAVGLPAILSQDLSNVTLAEPETVDGARLAVITAVVNPQRLATMSGGVIGTQPTTDPITVQLWLDDSSYNLHRLLLTEPLPDAPEPRRWQVDFSQFDQTVTIEPPLPPE
jgi:hypothetical protein